MMRILLRRRRARARHMSCFSPVLRLEPLSATSRSSSAGWALTSLLSSVASSARHRSRSEYSSNGSRLDLARHGRGGNKKKYVVSTGIVAATHAKGGSANTHAH